MDSWNYVKLFNQRQDKNNFQHVFQRKMHVTKSFVQRLSLQSAMEGHTGCVNCLQWNEGGDLLASGSDDLNIILWAPFLENKLHCFKTGHHGNIFSVKFLPGSDDRHIITGAGDFKVRVNDIAAEKVRFNCTCHGGRVKRIATAPSIANMFWSAAEDGMILQYDLRVPHQCSNTCNNVLVNLVYHKGKTAEAKCIAVNPVFTDLIAVGANDPYVRMYDRRMIDLTTARFTGDHSSSPLDYISFTGDPVVPGVDNLSPDCASYFIAGHLPLKPRDAKKQSRSMTATYVTFSPDGKDLLANLGGEQIYLFNIQKKRKQLVFNMSQQALSLNFTGTEIDESLKFDCCDDYYCSRNGTNRGSTSKGVSHHSDSSFHCSLNPANPSKPSESSGESSSPIIPKEVNDIKECANQAFIRRNYNDAISLYNSAIVRCPNAACLYSNRAAAYVKRGWAGDYYAAIRDCYKALELDPNYLKAHFRLAQCLQKLHWTKEAYDCLQAFKIKHPMSAKTKAFEVFENSLKMDIFAEISENECGENDSEDDASSSASGSSSQRSHSFNQTGLSDLEKTFRASVYDYEYRYCGHCNTTTDIKEANFFGSYGEFIIAGSDDGHMFIWDRDTTNIVRILKGDEAIVNCVQPHPRSCILATSGIDPVVRIWSPRNEDGKKDDREVVNKDDAALANQRRMNADPVEVMLLNMGYRIPGVLEPDDEESRSGPERNPVQCRTS